MIYYRNPNALLRKHKCFDISYNVIWTFERVDPGILYNIAFFEILTVKILSTKNISIVTAY